MAIWLALLLVILQDHFVHAQTHPRDQNQRGGPLTIQVNGLISRQGQLIVNIFSTEDGFPASRERAHRSLVEPISDQRTSTVTIADLSPGKYAVAVLHDQNVNGQLDTNFLGIPKEPTGTSRNVKGHFGPPKFQDAVFTLTSEALTITITLH
ncbi:MAG: DUF2141 domain-containing protein [Nitrospira sp.]|nr:DUF2141 domain-containing protein [Nitrospira sp.]